jgi:MoxR-like ATPase
MSVGTPHMSPEEAVHRVAQAREALVAEVHKIIIGQDEMIEQMLICMFSRGNCLTIGVPGLAKTLTISTISQALHMKFSRIQFTPDLMPSDITGTEIIDQDQATGRRHFRFVRGPVFANIVLADEINRTPPKTQSALLQAMQEHEVTSSGVTFPLPRPFWVLATQNPIEQEGTYPLPEAQLDRFMFSVEIDYPSLSEEVEIARTTTMSHTTALSPVLDTARVEAIRDLILRVPVADSVIQYAVKLARSTRPASPECPKAIQEFITWGAGPRASQYLVLAAKAYAALDARPTPDINDVKRAAPCVLRHRIVRSFHAETEGVSTNEIVHRLLE